MRFCRFTLVELLVVIAIIAILVGLVIGLAGVAREKSAESKTKMRLKNIELLLEKYKDERGAYPTAETATSIGSILDATDSTGYKRFFYRDSAGKKPYVSAITSITDCLDGWKEPIMYCKPSAGGAKAGAYDLFSKGSNKASGYPSTDDGDDLCNWKND